jgi:SAM-dependent methyltransferase
MSVSTWMVDALALQPGDAVLELAAGLGDTGFLAAELIQPGGTLISSDFAPEMLSAAQRRAEALGVPNVRFRQIDAETSIDQAAASVDAVLCRWGYMLMADPGTALRETRRVLKPGGRVALAAWAGPEENQWSSLPGREIVRRGLAAPPEPGEPGQFAWGEEGVVAEQLEDAGFTEYEVAAVEFVQPYPSADDWLTIQREMSARFGDAIAGLDEAALDDLRASLRAAAEPFTEPDGSLAIPARSWVAVATG